MKHTAEAQRNRILKRLRKENCSTFELRHEEDIPSPAPRVFELRHHYGYNILTHWTYGTNPGGGNHRIAKYVLMTGKWQRGAHE